jgi:hypothetical protein
MPDHIWPHDCQWSLRPAATIPHLPRDDPQVLAVRVRTLGECPKCEIARRIGNWPLASLSAAAG